MGEAEFFQALTSFGPVGVIIAFFVYRDWQREKNLGDQLQQQRDFVQTKMAAVIEKNTIALSEVADAMRGCAMNRSGAKP